MRRLRDRHLAGGAAAACAVCCAAPVIGFFGVAGFMKLNLHPDFVARLLG